jgi:hypothetical protein
MVNNGLYYFLEHYGQKYEGQIKALKRQGGSEAWMIYFKNKMSHLSIDKAFSTSQKKHKQWTALHSTHQEAEGIWHLYYEVNFMSHGEVRGAPFYLTWTDKKTQEVRECDLRELSVDLFEESRATVKKLLDSYNKVVG